jgi:hypothetical protein
MMILPSPRPIGSPPSTLLNGLVAYWKLEEASGTRFDSSGAGINLTAINNPGNAAGKIGNALSTVAASSQHVGVTNNAAMKWGGGDFSISYWVKYTTIAAYPPTVGSYISADNTTVFQFTLSGARGGNDIIFAVGNAVASAVSVALKGPSPSTGVWYHVVGRYTQSTRVASIHVNGAAGTDGSALPSDPTTGNVDFDLGGNLLLTGFQDGLIDEVSKWSRKLTTTEIATLYNGGNGVTWPFAGLP